MREAVTIYDRNVPKMPNNMINLAFFMNAPFFRV